MLLLTASLLASLAAATPAFWDYAVKEAHPVPSKWTKMGDAPADHVMRFDIALKQGQFGELERHLYEVSDPDHSRYGDHMSMDEVNELIKPSDDSFNKVHEWLESNGIEKDHLAYSNAKDWVSVNLPVGAAERLFNNKYSIFTHEDGTTVVRAPEWSLPRHLHAHIDMVSPTNSFFHPVAKRSTLKPVEAFGAGDLDGIVSNMKQLDSNPEVSKVCNESAVTPLCLRTLYGTINYKPQVPGKSKVGLTDYLGESNNRSDTGLFLKQFRPEAEQAAQDFKVVVINGGNNEQTQENATELAAGKDLEGNLDSETILGIAYPIPLTAYTTGGMPPFKPDNLTVTNTNEPYLDWVNYVLHQSNLPQAISTSYDDDEQTVPPSYAKRVCESFAQLGARGVSLFFASGDNGVGQNGSCFKNDGSGKPYFLPEFPSTCPYVTSVGATKGFNPEVAAFDPRNGFASGGGFSDLFPAPSYQKKVVADYVKGLKGQFKGFFNPNGRAYPDVSAQGQHYVTVWNGTNRTLDGTSAATPCFAAVVALVNDALLAEGKKPLGFLNPWLYSRGYKAFTDITSGSAIGCNSTGGGLGFPATKGWDAVTGWGTPNFPKFKDAACSGRY